MSERTTIEGLVEQARVRFLTLSDQEGTPEGDMTLGTVVVDMCESIEHGALLEVLANRPDLLEAEIVADEVGGETLRYGICMAMAAVVLDELNKDVAIVDRDRPRFQRQFLSFMEKNFTNGGTDGTVS